MREIQTPPSHRARWDAAQAAQTVAREAAAGAERGVEAAKAAVATAEHAVRAAHGGRRTTAEIAVLAARRQVAAAEKAASAARAQAAAAEEAFEAICREQVAWRDSLAAAGVAGVSVGVGSWGGEDAELFRVVRVTAAVQAAIDLLDRLASPAEVAAMAASPEVAAKLAADAEAEAARLVAVRAETAARDAEVEAFRAAIGSAGKRPALPGKARSMAPTVWAHYDRRQAEWLARVRAALLALPRPAYRDEHAARRVVGRPVLDDRPWISQGDVEALVGPGRTIFDLWG